MIDSSAAPKPSGGKAKVLMGRGVRTF